MNVTDRTICKAKIDGWKTHPELNKWVEGYYIRPRGLDIHYIVWEQAKYNEAFSCDLGLTTWEVDPETLCYCTGMKDCKEHRIFENDIIEFEDTGEEGYEYREGFDYINRAVVCWSDFMYTLDDFQYSGNSGVQDIIYDGDVCELNSIFTSSEVVGNRFDNAELLKGEWE